MALEPIYAGEKSALITQAIPGRIEAAGFESAVIGLGAVLLLTYGRAP